MDYKLVPKDDELYHYGVKGMRWGVRRYQNADGSLTNAGKKRIKRKMVFRTSYKNEAEVTRKMDSSEHLNPKLKRATEESDKAWVKREKANYRWQHLPPGDKKEKSAYQEFEKADREMVKKRNAEFDARDKYLNSWKSDLAGARLKDIKVEDTASGRQYVLDHFDDFGSLEWRGKMNKHISD